MTEMYPQPEDEAFAAPEAAEPSPNIDKYREDLERLDDFDLRLQFHNSLSADQKQAAEGSYREFLSLLNPYQMAMHAEIGRRFAI